MIPDRCHALMDIRITPDTNADEVMALAQEAIAEQEAMVKQEAIAEQQATAEPQAQAVADSGDRSGATRRNRCEGR